MVHTYVHTTHTTLTRIPKTSKLGEECSVGALRHPGPHTYRKKEEKKKTPPVPRSMPEQAATTPDAAVVFSADNLLPRMPALSFCENLWALLVREPRSPMRITR